MDSERFRKLLEAPAPFASVYFDDSHDTHDAEAQLELKWRALKEELERQGAIAAVIEEIGRAVLDLRPPIGRSGRGVVACTEGVLLNEHLTRPTAETVVRVSELPFVLPIVELGFDYPDYLLVVVDHTGADSPRTSTAPCGRKPSTAAATRCTKPPGPRAPDTATRNCAPTKPPARTCAPSPTGSASSSTTSPSS